MNTTHAPLDFTFTQQGCGKFHLSASQWIDRPVADIYDFFQRPANLLTLTPPEQHMHVIGDVPDAMSEGLEVTYGFRMLGVPMRWVAEISNVNPPNGFVDVQKKGPFLSWVHQHVFEADNGGTRIRDEVDYAVPFCRIGHGWIIDPRLRKLFQFRAAALLKQFPPQTGG